MDLNNVNYAEISARERLAEEFRRECQAESRLAEFRILGRATSNTKLKKSMRIDYRISSLNLAHHKTGGHNVCEQASAGCSSACVGGDSVGIAQIFKAVMVGRVKRTQFLFSERQRFIRQLIGELTSEQDNAERVGAVSCCRLNCYSDLDWHKNDFGCVPQIMSGTQFWDYVKVHRRILENEVPENWHLTASWSELKRHQSACIEILRTGKGNVAIPFHTEGNHSGSGALRQRLPGWIVLDGMRVEVFDGDNGVGPGCGDEPHYDLRFLDPGPTRSGRGRICGLRLKAGNNVARDMAIGRGFSLEVVT